MEALGGLGIFAFVIIIALVIMNGLKGIDKNDEEITKTAADFKNIFGTSHTTSLAQDLINTAYRAAQDELKGLKDKGTDGLGLKQISERSAEIDTAVKKLKDLKTMAEALDFRVPDGREK